MPELAEVDYYRRQWIADASKRFLRVFARPEKRVYRHFGGDPQSLCSEALVDSFSHGKQMLFRFSGNVWLGVHLGMTGSLHVFEGDYAPEKHDHLVLYRADGNVYVFRDPRQFGRLLLEYGEGIPERWRALPPQVLDETFTKNLLARVLKKHSRAPLKSVLLLQECFPGIGNWMADEVLYQSGIHPECAAGRLSDEKIEQLFLVLKHVCRVSMDVIAPDWGNPPENWLFHYRWRDGGICPQSGCSLERIKVGGRTTCFSPEIQLFGV